MSVYLKHHKTTTMFTKFVALVMLIAAVNGQADLYPAGIDPRLCPNYPDCADPAVAAKSIAASFGFPSAPVPTTQYFGNAAPESFAPTQYAAPAPIQYAAPAPTQYAAAPPAGVPAAATHPAGVDPRVCPNYPLCDNKLLSQFL